MTVRMRLMIVTIAGLALTMTLWGWFQIDSLDRMLTEQQGRALLSVAETVGNYYEYFPKGRGLSVLESALKDHLRDDRTLARIDIISIDNGYIEYIAGVGRVPYEWQWPDILAVSPAGRFKPRYLKLDTESGPALGLLYPVGPEKGRKAPDFVGVAVFSTANAEVLSQIRRLLTVTGAGLLIVIFLFLLTSHSWLIARPLGTIIHTIDEFQKGDYVRRIRLHRRDEWGRIASHFNSMADEIERVMANNRDLNRHLEDRVQEATQKLAQLQKQVNQLQQLTALGYLTATLAHDLGTPLHSIAGLTNLLLEREDWTPDVARKLQLILQQTQRLNAVIQKVRHVTRLPEPRFESVHIGDLLNETLPLIEPLIQKTAVGFDIMVPSGIPPVYIDRDRMQTALFNLIDNALEAMDGSGRITVTVRSDGDNREVTVTFEDSGSGIPAGVLERVSEPFFSTHENEGLRGLGLAIVQDILKAHGGRMEIESAPGEGTRVILHLPVADGASETTLSDDVPFLNRP
ncbi:MAG: HAMP domain-containing protein [Deltaproteobacteria bacterium]|nr:HAMP domain-containing protein [Deltaproteobacteria bacterium]